MDFLTTYVRGIALLLLQERPNATEDEIINRVMEVMRKFDSGDAYVYDESQIRRIIHPWIKTVRRV